MIITKSKPYTKAEIKKLKEKFNRYIKTVIDIENKVCSAGCDRYFESEKILLDQGLKQKNIWGGGIDLDTKNIDCNSFINIRPSRNNPTNEILDTDLRKIYEDLSKYFFKIIYE